MSNGKCNDCNVKLDEVVECSKCGYYCINCYESKHERWTLIHSENNCKDICHNCICEFCLSNDEGHIFVDAHGHDGSVAQLRVPCPVCNLSKRFSPLEILFDEQLIVAESIMTNEQLQTYYRLIEELKGELNE